MQPDKWVGDTHTPFQLQHTARRLMIHVMLSWLAGQPSKALFKTAQFWCARDELPHLVTSPNVQRHLVHSPVNMQATFHCSVIIADSALLSCSLTCLGTSLLIIKLPLKWMRHKDRCSVPWGTWRTYLLTWLGVWRICRLSALEATKNHRAYHGSGTGRPRRIGLTHWMT